jgi:hypothetical protein
LTDLIIITLLALSVTVWPWWMYRRMKFVREQGMAQSRESRLSKPVQPSFEEGTKAADGLIYGRDININEELIEADKNAASMPDIVKTLEGRR